MRRYKMRKTLPAVMARIIISALVLWLICMYAITAVAAEGIYVDALGVGKASTELSWAIARFDELLAGDEECRPGYENAVLWQAVRSMGMQSKYWSLPGEHKTVLNREPVKYDVATAIYDADGNLIAETCNFAIFSYYFEKDYQARQYDAIRGDAVWVLDRQNEPDTSRFIITQMFGAQQYAVDRYRLTGVLEDGYFTLCNLEIYYKAEYSDTGVGYWQEWPGFGMEIPENVETVTLYTDYIQTNTYTPSRDFLFQGTEMVGGLSALLKLLGPHYDYGYGNQFAMTDLVYTESRYYYDFSGWDNEEWDGREETYPEMEYRMTTALLASPWRSAISALWRVYFYTFAIMVVGVLVIRKLLKTDVVAPIAAVNASIADGWTILRTPDAKPLAFTEQTELSEHYEDTRMRLARNRDDINRLERAVKFAEEAEQNRRQMVANITHELKTPLAIIHSYAEGFRERIAEDKRDRYMDIIIAETERMDGMVLEMLDLSRLEAGRVKLLREDFSLGELAESVFARLERAIEAKELQLTLDLAEVCTVNADPVRIEQVITNFAANAVKYTPPGGRIYVNTASMRGKTTLAVENDSAPLSREALSKVWDTFYRADEARTGGGTGLGLAIAKSIIDLHGGSCTVRNTKTGVEFSFTL